MSSYSVLLTFDDGSGAYTLPLVQTIDDPAEGMKAVVIDGTRADGCVIIPGGKKSQRIRVTGLLYDADGYEDLTERINELKAQVTTNVATLTLKHDSDASGYVNDWQYTVRRIDEIEIDDNRDMRTDYVEYSCEFLVLSY